MIKKCSMCGEYDPCASDIRMKVQMKVFDYHGVEDDHVIDKISYTLCTECAAKVASFIDENRPTGYTEDKFSNRLTLGCKLDKNYFEEEI